MSFGGVHPFMLKKAGGPSPGGGWDGNTYSVLFNGTNQTCNLNFTLPARSAYTWMGWVKTLDTTGILVGDLSSASPSELKTSRGTIGWIEDELGEPNWIFIMGNGTTYDIDFTSHPTMVADGMWHHVALVVDGYAQEFFLDGVSEASWISSISAGTAGTNHIHVASWGAAYYWLDGNVDEVALFTSALSGTDIEDIYNAGVPADLSSDSPYGWWRMGDNNSGAGTTISDEGSNTSDGTLIGSPSFEEDVPE